MQTPVMFLNTTQNLNQKPSKDEDKKNENNNKIISPTYDTYDRPDSETKISTIEPKGMIQDIAILIPEPIIQNIVSTADFKCNLNLNK